MKCPVCSAEIPATAKFCGGCGATITPANANDPRPAARPPEPKPAAYATPDNPVPPSFSPSYSSSPAIKVEKKYKALRMIAMLYKIFAFVAGGACVLMALFLLVTGFGGSSRSTTTTLGPDPTAIFGGAVGALLLLVYGAFIFIFLYGLGEWMYVFMDIEENTRKTNETLASRPH